MSKDTEDTCRDEVVDGEPVRVHGSGEWDHDDRAMFAEVIRAVKRRLARDDEAAS